MTAFGKTSAAAPLLDDESIGLEGRVVFDDHQSLKLWLRLLSCNTQIETEIRKRLRGEFGMTLARFDYLAQLHRHADGLGMGALSRYLMVTGGNVTGLTDQLEKEGWVERAAEPGDRRSFRVRLTAAGRQRFEDIAATHERWVVDIFSSVSAARRHQLHELLGELRIGLSTQQQAAAAGRIRPQPAATASLRNGALDETPD